jgi:hypothetical protein
LKAFDQRAPCSYFVTIGSPANTSTVNPMPSEWSVMASQSMQDRRHDSEGFVVVHEGDALS